MILIDKSLELYVQSLLNKSINDFSDEDIQKIEVLSFEGDLSSENPVVHIEDVLKFPSVKKIIISNAIVSKDLIDILKRVNILSLQFNQCAFQNDDDMNELNSLESLEIVSSYNKSYDFLKKYSSLKILSIVNPFTEVPIPLDFFEKLDSLEYLTLQGCILDAFSYLAVFKQVHYLNLLASDIPTNPVDTFNRMDNLKSLYVSNRHNLEGLRPGIVVRYDFNHLVKNYT